jgi:hypothetical protein
MKRDDVSPPSTVTRRQLLSRSACTLTALSATPWISKQAMAQTPLGVQCERTALGARVRLPKSVAGVRIPDSKLAQASANLVYDVSPETMANHCMRTYVFAALTFANDGVAFDEELTFVAAALHDLGLVDRYMSPTGRFEVDGADAAVAFLKQYRLRAGELELIWDAIALHSYGAVALRKAPEIAAISIGSALDVSAVGYDALRPEDIAAVIAAFPRLNFKEESIATVLHLCETKPQGVALTAFSEVGRKYLPGFPAPTLDELFRNSPFEE